MKALAARVVWVGFLAGCRRESTATEAREPRAASRSTVEVVRGGVPTACDRAPRVRFDGLVVDRFDNASEDDGGDRTELTVRRAGKDVRLTADYGIDVYTGRTYTFFVDDDGEFPTLVEIRRGPKRVWNESGGYAGESTVREVDGGRRVELQLYGKTKRFPVSASLRRVVASAPGRAWIVEIDYTDGADGQCESLMRIGLKDPSKLIEVYDPINGPRKVVGTRWFWEAS